MMDLLIVIFVIFTGFTVVALDVLAKTRLSGNVPERINSDFLTLWDQCQLCASYMEAFSSPIAPVILAPPTLIVSAILIFIRRRFARASDQNE